MASSDPALVAKRPFGTSAGSLECGAPEIPKGKRAAQYIRMSTDAQDLSPEIQSRAISDYAKANGFTVVQTYLDAGRSGVTLKGRPAMKRLLSDVATAGCLFSEVLVYDISRWGRFQDTDASAYYEYHCRMHGVQVRYIQEPFLPSETPFGNVLKNLKRAMAAEYSRELAVKVRAGQKAALDAGFHIGGVPCVGIRRVAVSKHDGAERKLGPSDHKAANSEHVRWVKGPEDEVALLRRIFHLYVTSGISIYALANRLSSEGVTSSSGRPLTPWMLYSLLSCETPVGNFVWGRRDHGRRRSESDPYFWRVADCIEPAVSLDVWKAAQKKRAQRAGTIRSRDELLAYLAHAVRCDPQFNASKLKGSDGPSRETYRKHFGSFAAALACLGLKPAGRSREEYAHLRKARALGRSFRDVLEVALTQNDVRCMVPNRQAHLLVVNGVSRVRVQVIWRETRHGVMQWSMRKIYREAFDYVFVVRLEVDDTPYDSLLMAREDYFAFDLWFGDELPSGDFQRFWSVRDIAAVFAALNPIPLSPRSRSEAGVLGRDRRDARNATLLPARSV